MFLSITILITAILALLAGMAFGSIWRKHTTEAKIGSIEQLSQRMIEEAQREAANLKKEAALQNKDTLYQMKQELDREIKEQRSEQNKLERRLIQKEENLDKKADLLSEREMDINKRINILSRQENEIGEKIKKLDDSLASQRAMLEKIAGITSDQAKEMLLKNMEDEARYESAKVLRRIEAETREIADKKSKDILSLAIKRYAGDYVAERTISVVNLPGEEMKGRIIGREGRNIRAIEAATGVDLIVDDTPEAVILSCFNPIRREVARLSLERLISDGRIHPARIEEIVNKVGEEMEVAIREAGEQATFDVGVHGIHPELIKLIGKLKYRSSYAQNVLQHSIEVAFLCGIMAAELGLNVKQAKRAGLLHDIGKAVDHEVEGPHALIGADLSKRYGEAGKVIHAIRAHHEDITPDSILAVLVQAADTLSGARPGARREMLETYVKRLEDLEQIASSFQGISKSYAIQAGREVRIIVDSDQVNDSGSALLCNEICRKIEKELSYPGQIRVTVIRETRTVDFAK
ncbi:MAG: ribonuclease Y [Deltaproteobacteria bacterium]|nr:ribonuclease Y [Deltaproteobacteria bacterium]MBW2052201.1 ribonuclease Y [Deltaproteobacteria bacterium]MBW2140772.1 ribonuclease Y [Deltaproteobacteria bacterium]MBW2323660.1 ribonuclease Y [Deltaproteobacteria bacterium]